MLTIRELRRPPDLGIGVVVMINVIGNGSVGIKQQIGLFVRKAIIDEELLTLYQHFLLFTVSLSDSKGVHAGPVTYLQ